MSEYPNPNPAKILYLFAEIQKHLHNGTIRHELNQIVKHTKDQEILDNCKRAAECLDIQLDAEFYKIDENQYINSHRTLCKHLKWANERFNEVSELKSECDPKWIESPFKATESQIFSLTDCYMLLDKVPDITDIKGEVIRVGDLVAVSCTDDSGKEYEHYGVVIQSSKGFRIAHFFTGATVKSQNSLVEKGFGYIHEFSYEPTWIVKDHPSHTIPYGQIDQRIKESRKLEKRVWNKLTYNCEHWAREMTYGQSECTQLKNFRNEIRKRKEKE